MRALLLFLLLGASLLPLSPAHAQSKGPADVAEAEQRVVATQLKLEEQKKAVVATRDAAAITRGQFKTQQVALKDLQTRLAKQDAEARVATAKQKSLEAQLKREQLAVQNAKKREKGK